MRIYQALISPRGVLGLTLLAFALAFVALLLDQADFKSPLLVYTFGVLAGITALGTLVAFFGPRIWPLLGKTRSLRFRWPFTLTPVVEPRLKLSPQEMAERHIRYRAEPIRLVDLLEVAGENGVLRDFQFEHCILEGPGVIDLKAPFPPSSGSSLSLGLTHCRVEGSAETTLYRITRGQERPVGLIGLPGHTFRSVTFKGLGFAGSPDHLEWLKTRLIFSERPAEE